MMLHVYGIEGEVDLDDEIPGLLGILDDGGWSYLVFDRDATDELPSARLDVQYEATLPYSDWLDGDLSACVEEAGLLIVAPWHARPPAEDPRPRLFIEPSLVFGTGAHPTTRRCLRLIAALIRSKQAETILDLGCGTGVLSLAALRLGAKQATGCDISALAVDVARRNARSNGLDDRVTFEHASAADLVRPADLVLANLPPAALSELLAHPALGHAPWIISSGLLAGDLDRLRAGIPQGVEIVEAVIDGFWHTALLQRWS